jgi:histidinol-phosphate aminotransferase
MKDHVEHLRELWRPPLKQKDPDGYICLNHNEAPFNGAESLNINLSDLHLYPEPFHLYGKLAQFHNVKKEQLLLTCGSEQALRYVFDTFLGYGDKVVHPYPTFGMIEVYTHYRRSEVGQLAYDENRQLSLDKIIEAIDDQTRLFYLANPDSPTGTAYTLDEVEKIANHCCSNTNTIFLLDEAYFPFYAIDSLSLLQKYPNLIITRTFSKAWGLAGARVGYIISNEENIELLRRQKLIDELNSLSIQLCMQALDHPEIVERNVNQVHKWKEIFKRQKSDTISYLETEGNYITLKSTELQSNLNALKENKIIPRVFREDCLQHCMRFSVSSDDIMQKIIDILY